MESKDKETIALEQLNKEISKLNLIIKSNEKKYEYNNLPKKVTKVLDDIDKNYNCSWPLFMYNRNKQCNALNKIAIFYRGNKITYSQMYATAFKYAKALKMLGIKKDDQVLVCISNLPEYVYLNIACGFIGAQIHLIGSWFSQEYLNKIVQESKSSVLFASEDKFNHIFQTVENSNIETIILVSLEDSLIKNSKGEPYNPYSDIDGKNHVFSNKIEETKKLSTKKIINQQEFLELGQKYQENVLEHTIIDSVATITYTSGTTKKGYPKGLKHSHRAYITVSRFKSSDVSGMPEMKNLVTMYNIPVYSHTNVSNLTDTLYCNCTYVAEPFNEIEFFMKSILINKPNYCQSPVGQWLYLGKELLKEENINIKFPFLMLPDVVGEGCTPGEEKFLNTIAKKHKFGTGKLPFPLSPVTFTLGGGTCETGGLFFTLFHALQQRKITMLNKKLCLGLTPVKMAEVQVLNQIGDYCSVGEPGLIVVNSPATTLGYIDKTLDENLYIVDKYGKKWANTGTLGYVAEPYYRSIKMKSRANDYSFLQNGRIFPTFLIEEAVSKDTKNVLSCTVIKLEEYYVCHIEKQPNSKIDKENLIFSVSERLKTILPQEIFEKIYIKYRTNQESFPIAKSGKRDLTELMLEDNVESLVYAVDVLKEKNISLIKTNL